MNRVYVFLADGFEEVEGLTVVDILRRAGADVTTVSITGNLKINGSHGIGVMADVLFDEEKLSDGDMYVLPGGMPGTLYLGEHDGLGRVLLNAKKAGKRIAAICAAPSVLGALGLLEGERAVCYPGMEDKLLGAETGTEEVVCSGQFTTSRGVGTAIPFALALTAQLKGQEEADRIAKSIVFRA
ncbi:MAG: DJ-1/PfpI family protein [Lachnospiraceae bacterium]|nr:DJ-1/PfpI family protein [Lachnospiraceae bacterium]